jgi:O-antigen/teichoic acid export membrane protein
MRTANRLIFNTLVTFARMAVTVGLGLVTTRLLYEHIGEVNFGIYSVIAAALSFIALISNAILTSAQRHLAYELGRNNSRGLHSVFSTSLIVCFAFAAFAAALGMLFQPLVVHALRIPAERLDAATWVYTITLLGISCSMIATPFFAVFGARQAMAQDAVFSIFTSIVGLVVVFLLPYSSADSLASYATFLVAGQVFLLTAQAVRGLILFPETRFRFKLIEFGVARQLLSFAGWNLLGVFAWQVRAQGGNIVLNLFFGPAANASYAVASQASMYMTNFSGTIARATQPAMTTMRGAGVNHQMYELALTTTKLTVAASSLVAIPAILDAKGLLQLWLGRIPTYAETFVPLMLVGVLIIQFITGHNLVINADGRIKRISRYMFWIIISPVPLSALLFSVSAAPPSYFFALVIISSLVGTLFYIVFVGRQIDMPLKKSMREIGRTVAPIACGTVMASLPLLLLSTSAWRFVAVFVAYAVVAIPATWIIGLAPRDRARFRTFAKFVKEIILRRLHAKSA